MAQVDALTGPVTGFPPPSLPGSPENHLVTLLLGLAIYSTPH